MKEIKDNINRCRDIPCSSYPDFFLGRKNKYCENYYTTKCNLKIKCDPYQITNDIFHRTSSVAQSCLTLCDPMDCSMPGVPVHHQLPEFTLTHVR